MQSNNPSPTPTGLPYLWSYAGGLNILEELLNATIIILLAFAGFSLKANLFCGIALLAAIQTAIFMFLHMKGIIRRSKLAWHWYECVSVLTIALLLAIFSSVIMSVFTRGYIITGVLGYVTSMVYFFDTFQKYQIAVMPVPQYAWTTPNMPELN